MRGFTTIEADVLRKSCVPLSFRRGILATPEEETAVYRLLARGCIAIVPVVAPDFRYRATLITPRGKLALQLHNSLNQGIT